MKEILLFLAKFLVISAALFVLFTLGEEVYYRILAHVTAVTTSLTGTSMHVMGVEGNTMILRYSGMELRETLMFAAFNPVILIALLLATPRVGKRIVTVGVPGLVLLLLAQVLTLRLLVAIDVRGYRGSPGLEVLEVVALISICVNWVLPLVIWVAWVPTGFLSRALRAGISQG